MYIKKYSFLLIMLLVSLTLNAETAESSLLEAEKAYNNADYNKAAEIYNKIIVSDGVSADLLYNLGNVYLKAGDYGHAMLSYMRAKKLSPSDSKINNNITFLAGKVNDNNVSDAKGAKDKVSPDQNDFFGSLYESLFKDTSSDTWAWIGAFAFILLISAVAVYIFTSNVLWRKIGFFSSIALFLISLVSVIFSFMAASENASSDEGVVMGYKVILRQSPQNDAKETSTPLNRGTILSIIEKKKDNTDSSEWYKVRLNNKTIGWIDAENFNQI